MKRKPPASLSLEATKNILRSAGLRCTAARVAVIQCLGDNPVPLTPSDVVDKLHDFGFDKSTIYRSLTELHDAGLLTRLDLGDSVRRYELLPIGGSGSSEHPHFMCVSCGQVQCLADFRFELTAADSPRDFPGKISEVLLRGQCSSCG